MSNAAGGGADLLLGTRHLGTHLVVREPAHILRMTERVILDLDERVGGKHLHCGRVVARESAAHEYGERQPLLRKVIDDSRVQRCALRTLAGIEGQRDDARIAGYARDDRTRRRQREAEREQRAQARAQLQRRSHSLRSIDMITRSTRSPDGSK